MCLKGKLLVKIILLMKKGYFRKVFYIKIPHDEVFCLYGLLFDNICLTVEFLSLQFL